MSELIGQAGHNLAFAGKGSVLNVNLKFVSDLNHVQLKSNDSLLLIGKSRDVRLVEYSHISKPLNELQIPQRWFTESINYTCQKKDKSGNATESEAKQSNGSNVSWMNRFIIQTISGKYSRNNTPSRAHLITKQIRSNSFADNQLILVACERRNAVACACAVARAFSLYSAKTGEDKKTTRNVSVSFLFVESQASINPTNEETACFNVLAHSVRLTAKIVETPCADMTTNHFLDEINVVANELGLVPFVIEGEELNRQGFGGLYNVGKAAVNPPKLVVLSNLKPQAKRTVAWVGKGIVYDTGGLCIKSRTNMCSMKADCGGAAGILGAFYAAVKLGFEDNLHAVFCLAENAVAANAYRPDDIIKLYSGKTVEITNTDAEGRLVLGDGVAYAEKDLKADIIVDMATLTGGQGPATGKYHAAVVTNNEKWERACVEVGKKSADLCYPLVFAPELQFSEFNSDLADMKNSVTSTSNATSACAGLFIHAHLSSKFEGVWIHLDMAEPVFEGPRATGYGVAILNSLFGNSSLSSTIRSIAPVDADSLPVKNDSGDLNSED